MLNVRMRSLFGIFLEEQNIFFFFRFNFPQNRQEQQADDDTVLYELDLVNGQKILLTISETKKRSIEPTKPHLMKYEVRNGEI